MAVKVPPTLQSERLVLRGFVPEDLPASIRLWNDPAVYAGISGKPSSPETCWQRLLSGSGSWQMLGFGYWALCERQSSVHIGEVGIADFSRDLEPALACSPEAGWVLSPSVHGKGYATEAMRLVYTWFDQAFPAFDATYCITDADNLASIGVAKKLGFVQVTGCKYKEHAVTRWMRKAPGSLYSHRECH